MKWRAERGSFGDRVQRSEVSRSTRQGSSRLVERPAMLQVCEERDAGSSETNGLSADPPETTATRTGHVRPATRSISTFQRLVRVRKGAGRPSSHRGSTRRGRGGSAREQHGTTAAARSPSIKSKAKHSRPLPAAGSCEGGEADAQGSPSDEKALSRSHCTRQLAFVARLAC